MRCAAYRAGDEGTSIVQESALSSAPHVLLLTGTMPGDGEVGAMFLRDLCRFYRQDSLVCFAIAPPGSAQPSMALDWLPMTIVPRPVMPWRDNPNSRIAAGKQFLWSLHNRVVVERQLLEQVTKCGSEHQVDLVWAILDSPVIYRLAAAVADKLAVPLVTTVWDPAEYVVAGAGLGPYWRRIALNDFSHSMRRAIRSSVMSDAMRDEYVERYGVRAIIMRHGLAYSDRLPPGVTPTSNARFLIGFAGSLYAKQEWKALLSALDTCSWHIAGKDIYIRVLTRGEFRQYLDAGESSRIEYLGWRSMAETIRLLSEMDVNYLPYWFDPAYDLSVRLCFPTKLTSYLASGRPVFFHGPSVASPAHFLTRYGAGASCHSLDHAAIIETLTQLIIDTERYASMAEAGRKAMDQELTQDIFLSRFAELIGIEAKSLQPESPNEAED